MLASHHAAVNMALRDEFEEFRKVHTKERELGKLRASVLQTLPSTMPR